MNRLGNIFFFTNPTATLEIFRKCIYLVMAYIMIVMTLPNALHYWGHMSYLKNWQWGDTFMLKFQYLMMEPWLDNIWYLLVLVHIVSLVLAFIGKFRKVAHIALFITTVWLYHRMFLYVIGGDLLLISLLFYLLFANEKKTEGFGFDLNRWILLACQVQICFVYFFSGLWKLAGAEWLNGSAMHYILQIEEYSHPWIIENLANQKWFTVIGTYSALAYQLLFPILVWVKKIKKPFLLIGVLFHLFIGTGMGIWDFALIMIASYAAFIDHPKEDKKVEIRSIVEFSS